MNTTYVFKRNKENAKIDQIQGLNKTPESIVKLIEIYNNKEDRCHFYEIVKDPKMIEVIKWALSAKDRDLKEVLFEIDNFEEQNSMLMLYLKDLKDSINNEIT